MSYNGFELATFSGHATLHNSHDDLVLHELRLLTSPCTAERRSLLFHSHTHTCASTPPSDTESRGFTSSVFFWGAFRVWYVESNMTLAALLMVFPIRPFGHYFTAPFFPSSSKGPMTGLMTDLLIRTQPPVGTYSSWAMLGNKQHLSFRNNSHFTVWLSYSGLKKPQPVLFLNVEYLDALGFFRYGCNQVHWDLTLFGNCMGQVRLDTLL